jgi:hypothetical protein
MVNERVAHFAQGECVDELRKQQRDDVAPRREGADVLVHAILVRERRCEILRNVLANLFKNASLSAD